MDNLGPLIGVGLSLLVLGWVIFRLIIRRAQQVRSASPQQQVEAIKREFDQRDARGERALRDAPADILRWQVEINEQLRAARGELDTKIQLLAATVRLADQRIAELKGLLAAAEQRLEQTDPPAND
jgi:flagellar biosynthesis/type III secretory pathway M-ring protein FliF/YscJ